MKNNAKLAPVSIYYNPKDEKLIIENFQNKTCSWGMLGYHAQFIAKVDSFGRPAAGDVVVRDWIANTLNMEDLNCIIENIERKINDTSNG